MIYDFQISVKSGPAQRTRGQLRSLQPVSSSSSSMPPQSFSLFWSLIWLFGPCPPTLTPFFFDVAYEVRCLPVFFWSCRC